MDIHRFALRAQAPETFGQVVWPSAISRYLPSPSCVKSASWEWRSGRTGTAPRRETFGCHGGHPQIVELLLRSGANPALADNDGRTPLDWATMNDVEQQNAEVVAILRAATRAQSS